MVLSFPQLLFPLLRSTPLFPDTSFHIPSNLRIQVCSQGTSTLFSLQAAHSLPTSRIHAPLLPVLQPYFLTFDHLPYFLTSSTQHSSPTYSNTGSPFYPPSLSPWTILFGNSSSSVHSKHPAHGTLTAVKPIVQPGLDSQGLGSDGRGLGHMLLGLASTSHS